MEKLSNNRALSVGDRLKIELRQRFSLGGTVDAYMLAGRIDAIQRSNAGYTIERWELVSGGIDLYIIVNPDYANPQAVQAGAITPAVIITAIVGLSVIMFSASAYLITDRAAAVLENPAAASVVSKISGGVTVSILAAAAVLIYYWSKKK